MRPFDVAILGCGRTGAALAKLVAGRCLSVLVIDRIRRVLQIPLAVHLEGETMEAFAARRAITPFLRFGDAVQVEMLDKAGSPCSPH